MLIICFMIPIALLWISTGIFLVNTWQYVYTQFVVWEQNQPCHDSNRWWSHMFTKKSRLNDFISPSYHTERSWRRMDSVTSVLVSAAQEWIESSTVWEKLDMIQALISCGSLNRWENGKQVFFKSRFKQACAWSEKICWKNLFRTLRWYF